jgi:hypothetical protein
MGEQEFWTRCFQSAFFARDRKQIKAKDSLFDKIAVEEEEALTRADYRGKVSSMLVDLTENDGMEGYSGNAPDVTMQSSKSALSSSLIKKLNRHGELVLIDEKPQLSDETPRHVSFWLSDIRL